MFSLLENYPDMGWPPQRSWQYRSHVPEDSRTSDFHTRIDSRDVQPVEPMVRSISLQLIAVDKGSQSSSREKGILVKLAGVLIMILVLVGTRMKPRNISKENTGRGGHSLRMRCLGMN